jgi:hypothetical protein
MVKHCLDSTSLADLRTQILENTDEEAIRLLDDGQNEINMYTSGTGASNLRLQITDSNTFVKNTLNSSVIKTAAVRSDQNDNSTLIQSNDGTTNIRFVPQNATIAYLQNYGTLAFTKIGEGNSILAINHTDGQKLVHTNAEFNINVTAADNTFALYKCPGGEQVSIYSHSGLSEGMLLQKAANDDGIKLNMYHSAAYRPIYLNSANNGKLVIGTENVQADAEKFIVESTSRFKNGLKSNANIDLVGTAKVNFNSNYIQNDASDHLNMFLANDKNYVVDSANDQSFYEWKINGNSVMKMTRDVTTTPLAPNNKTQISSQKLSVKDDNISGGYVELERTGATGTLAGYINYYNSTGRLFYTGFNTGADKGNPLHYFEDQCLSYIYKNSLSDIMKIISHDGVTYDANSNYVEINNRLECPNIQIKRT